ncbi:MAG TPA: SpoIID/LytB domain-containing protein [Terriglobales bacterium]|nr:SpoIID/LytB domain-containing protein [Terriglobales bacterium]
MSRRPIIAAALLALAGAPHLAAQDSVRIGVLGLFHPREFTVRPAGDVLRVECGAHRWTLEGTQSVRLRLRPSAIECVAGQGRRTAASVRVRARSGEADFLLAVPGRIERRYRGVLEIAPRPHELEAVVVMDREVAVASAVAAESPPGAPLEALKAQAVVTRSYYAATRGRHPRFDFCDTTHCQFLRQPPQQGSLAWLAAQSTRGWVLAYQGATLPALYSASCGGRTHTLAELGLRADGYPYFAVDCPYCQKRSPVWESRLDPAEGEPLLGARSERARLAVGRELGWSAVPGADYQARREGGEVVVRGRGAGHGLGLCQAGAADLAAHGSSFRQILEHYFPNTTLANLDDHGLAAGR